MRYRTLREDAIVDKLLVHGWRLEAVAGDRKGARAAARAALERLLAAGLPFATSSTGAERYFDPAEVLDYVVWAGLERGEPTFEAHCIGSARRETERRIERSRAPTRWQVTLRRAFALPDRAPGERVRLRLPLPLEDAGCTEVTVEVLAPGAMSADLRRTPGRLEAVVAATADGEVELAARIAFTGHPWSPKAAALGPAERELYSRPHEGLIRTTPAVADLAARLARPGDAPLQRLRRFRDHLYGAFGMGEITYEALDPSAPLDWVLEHRWYDCQLGVALLCALCRAQGIPARSVTGYMLDTVAPCFHTWMEAWIEDLGWFPVDLLAWSLSVAGRDSEWVDYAFGWMEQRMVVERPPRQFVGMGSARLPPTWRMSFSMTARGRRVRFEDFTTGALIYGEDIEVEDLGAPPRAVSSASGRA